MKLSDINIQGFDTLLLDRDGTINVHIIGDYVCCWDDFEFIPGVLETLSGFANHFRHIFIVTNQRGVEKGRFTEKDLANIHMKMVSEIEKTGGRIDGIYYCTSLSEDNFRRKPRRGMFDDILKDYPDVKPETTLMVGDGDVDMDFARNCGVKGVKIDSLKREGHNYYWTNV